MHHLGRDQALTPRRRGGEQRRRIAGGFGVSLLLHALVLLALVLRLKWEPEPEILPPPATVDMVFEGGKPAGPTTETPTPGPPISGIPPAPVGGPPGEGPPPPSSPPPELPPAPEPLAPTIQALRTAPEAPPPTPEQPAPQPESPPAAAAAPPPPAPAVPPPPPPEPPSRPAPGEVTVPPPEPVLPPVPEPQPPPPIPKPEVRPPAPKPVVAPPPAKPETQPPIRQASPAAPRSDFPAPMDFSLNRPPAEPGAAAAVKPVLTLALPKKGPNDSSPFSIDTDADVGPDWRNALSAWVAQHSYYPQQAAELGEQGTVKVEVVMMPDGQVVSVDLERRSGSPWLDLALQGLFRGAKLPPMPKEVGDQPVPFHFTMHYILIR
jgi:TonB family protein